MGLSLNPGPVGAASPYPPITDAYTAFEQEQTPRAAPATTTPSGASPAAATTTPATTAAAPTGLLPSAPDTSQMGGGKFGYWTLAEMGTEQALAARQAGGYASALDTLTAPALKGYANFLSEMTSADPGARMAAAGPGVTAVTKQQEAARKNIAASVPRGGAKDYLEGMSYIQQSSDIGNLIDQAWLSAEQQQGQFGEWGAEATQKALSLEQLGLSEAASTTGLAVGMKRDTQAANQQAIAGALEEASMFAAMYA